MVAAAISFGLTSMAHAQLAGVMVDADGVLKKQIASDPGGRLAKERITAARASLNPDVTAFSKLRMISLNRLEAALKDRQGVPTEEMRRLAGLLRLRYVFFYPESNDIVIAGPAEGWYTDATGRVVGMTSHRPTIELQDLVVALRAFPPGGKETDLIGCSIDPTQEGLAAMQGFLRKLGGQATPNQTQYIVEGLRNCMGKQIVSVDGVEPTTHFAQVLVEADYRMKLIGVGMEKPPIRLASFVDRANPKKSSANALQRWFFMPDYQCVRVSENGLAMELVGDGVKLVGENEAVSSSGQRRQAGRENHASKAFVTDFTRKYSELADRSPVFAQLRNLIDMSVAAAFIQKEDYYGQSGWKLGLVGDEDQFSVETYNAPKLVATAVTAKWKGRTLMTPVGGGVQIEATRALDEENLLEDKKNSVGELHKKTKIKLAKGQWWWD
ncbi:MAG: DUF1598 domain-containing protein [Planctomycetota bacterium]|nr:DUF1598 domain-containing protein [Planctomycetota bacterium]